MGRNFDTYRSHISQQSGSTQRMFVTAYNSFPGIEDLIKSNPSDKHLYDVLQKWMNGLKLNPTTVRLYFTFIRQYLYYMGIKLYPEDIKRGLRLPKLYVEELYPLSRKEIAIILEGCDSRHRVLYLAQLSSGMRIGEIVQIRRRHLHTNMQRIMVKIPAMLTKSRRSRTTFFSQEVSQLLDPEIGWHGPV